MNNEVTKQPRRVLTADYADDTDGGRLLREFHELTRIFWEACAALEGWSSINSTTDAHGWGKDFYANCANERELFWGGRAALDGWSSTQFLQRTNADEDKVGFS